MAKRILVVDDEETLREALRFNLEAEGYAVDVAASAEEVLAGDVSCYNLLLLDIMMSEISGTQLARILKSRPETACIPIIFCTAKDKEEDMVDGLDMGADDYIMKPFSIRNVLARVRAVLRRYDVHGTTGRSAASLVYGGLVADPSGKQCTVDGREVKMARKEFEILCRLMSDIGRIFTREELLRDIWPDEVVVLDRVIDVNINRIRRKIGQYGRHIVTRSGYGYGFVE